MSASGSRHFISRMMVLQFPLSLSAADTPVLIPGESVMKFQGNYLVLEHGRVAVWNFHLDERARELPQPGPHIE